MLFSTLLNSAFVLSFNAALVAAKPSSRGLIARDAGLEGYELSFNSPLGLQVSKESQNPICSNGSSNSTYCENAVCCGQFNCMPMGATCCDNGMWCPSGTSCMNVSGSQMCQTSSGSDSAPSSSVALVNVTATATGSAPPSSTSHSAATSSGPQFVLGSMLVVSFFMTYL